jgi:hypothetical protein
MVGEHLTGYSRVNNCFLLIMATGLLQLCGVAKSAIIEKLFNLQNIFYYPLF